MTQIHLHHCIEDYQQRKPHKGHELRRGRGNERPRGLNAWVHAGCLKVRKDIEEVLKATLRVSLNLDRFLSEEPLVNSPGGGGEEVCSKSKPSCR